MRALLLAAGFGTRLKPLTNHLPKCLVPIHGRPLLDYWLELLTAGGIQEILVNTHYMAPLVYEYIRSSSWGRNVSIVYEKQLLGTGGTISANRDFFRGEPLMVAHADNLTLFDPMVFADSHHGRPSGSALSMMLFETDDPKSCGIVELDHRAVVKAFHEKVQFPPGNLANAAVYILEPEVLDFLASLKKRQIDFSTEVLPHFMGRISTFKNTLYHRDIGTLASWQEAHVDFTGKPSSIHNAQVWQRLLTTVDAESHEVIQYLLAKVPNYL